MCTKLSFNITPVRTVEDLEATINLFRAYAESLDIDLAFQNFENEMATMPEKYAPPTGELLLARNSEGEPISCLGLRPFEPSGSDCCEMKRLYTLPTVRGFVVGKALVITILDIARTLGYKEIKLDILPSMEVAIGLYKQVGFVETEAYYDTPIVETIFLVRSPKDFETQTPELKLSVGMN
jgi:GNAT superfamily N-acetyltransferase